MKPLLLLLLVAPACLHAQVIRGTVVDDATQAPVALANISILAADGHAITTALADTSGVFQLPVPEKDSVRVRVERIGYGAVTSPAYALKRGEDLELEIHLNAQAVALAPVKVVARVSDPRLQEFYRRAEFNKKLGRGRIWLREDLEHHRPASSSYFLHMVPPAVEAGCRGMQVYVDDLPVEDERELNITVQPDDLEGVEIYRGMDVPERYHGLCEVVLMWRKPYAEGGRPFSWGRVLIAGGLAAVVLVLTRLF